MIRARFCLATLLNAVPALVLYAGVDVDYSTGQLRFSEKLASVVGHRLSYQVKLRYSSDIRRGHVASEAEEIAAERAGWVGLGFDLDMPYIERVIVGAPDNASGNTYESTVDMNPDPVYNEFAEKTNRIYWNCYNYRPLVYRTAEGYGTSYHVSSHAYEPNGRPKLPIVHPRLLYDDPEALNRCGASSDDACHWCEPLDFERVDQGDRPYLPSSQLNQQTQQDRYMLHGFPGGGGQLYFAMAQRESGKMFVNVAPYHPWQIDYSILEPAPRDTNGEIHEWYITDENGTRYIFGGTTSSGVDARVWFDETDTWGTLYRTAQITNNLAEDDLEYCAVEKFGAGRTVERWYLRRIESYDRKDSIVFDYRAIVEPVQVEDRPYVSDLAKWRAKSAPFVEYDLTSFINKDASPVICEYLRLKVGEGDYIYVPLEPVSLGVHRGRYTFAGSQRLGGALVKRLGCEGLVITVFPDPNECPSIETITRDGWLDPGEALRIEETAQEEPITLLYKDIGGGAAQDLMEQAIIQDKSHRYSQTLVPLSVSSPLQKIVFDERVQLPNPPGNPVPARTDEDPLGRGRLDAIHFYDINPANGEESEHKRVTFIYDGASENPTNRLRLREIHTSTPASRAQGKKRRMYRFGYCERAEETDLFGRVNIGLLDTVIDVDGGATIALYQKGSYDRMSNNSSVPLDEFGWRVCRVTRRGGFGTPDVVDTISYEKGEINYGSAFKYVAGEDFWYGIDEVVDVLGTEFDKTGLEYTLALDRYNVHYGIVHLRTPGEGPRNTTRYEYLQSDEPGLSDGENEYNPNALYRYRIDRVAHYMQGRGTPIKETRYHYGIADVVAEMADDLGITQDEARKRLRYAKPMTRMDQFELGCCNDPCVSGIESYYPDRLYGVTGMRGMGADTLVRTMAVRLERVENRVNGMQTITEYEYNAKGFPKREKRTGPSHPGVTLIKERTYGYELERELYPVYHELAPLPQPVYTPAEGEEEDDQEGEEPEFVGQGGDCRALYPGGPVVCYHTVAPQQPGSPSEPITIITESDIPSESFFLQHNVLSPVVLKQTQEMRESWDSPVTLTASANLWRQPWPNAPWYPTMQYVWAVEHGDDGYPANSFDDVRLEPFTQAEPSSAWQHQSEITKRDRYTRTLEQNIAGGTMTASTIYRPDLDAVEAAISAAHYDGCAVFTCDYDLQGPRHFDPMNKWERGGAHDASGVVAVTAERPHFGLKSVHVKNGWGPTRNVPFAQDTNYEFWAWVYPKTSAGKMAVEFRMPSSGVPREDQERYIGAWSRSLTDLPLNQWSPVRFEIRADQIADHLLDGYEVSQIGYMRIWIGNGRQESACDLYVDDMRFHPAAAHVSTTYYYSTDRWSLPRLSVGVDGNPGPITEYDEYCAPIKTWQFAHDGQHVLMNERECYVQGDDVD